MRTQKIRTIKCPFTLAISAFLALSASSARALPILELDVDPTRGGIQSSVEVAMGDLVRVDIVISSVDAIAPLNAFELDVVFGGTSVVGSSVSAGSFLLSPVLEIQLATGVSQVDVALASLLPAGASGSGVLASFEVRASELGLTSLDFENVILSAPFGIQVLPEAIRPGEIRVTGGTAPIPEPSAALLFAVGTMVVMGAAWPKAKGALPEVSRSGGAS